MKVLIHIGYPKAASTFLQHYFSAHPNIFYTGSILGSYKFSGEVEIQKAEFRKEQTHFVISEEQLSVWQGNLDIVGVKFKDYDIQAQQKKTALQLHAEFPDAKILLITRGFVSAWQSMYSQYVSIGGFLSFPDFEKANSKIFSDFYNYNFLIEIYREIFGSNDVLILPFEMLKQNPSEFLRLINTQADLPAFNFDTEAQNASLEKEEMESYRKLSSIICRSISWLPYSIQKNIYGLYVYFLYSRKLHAFTKLFSSSRELLEVSDKTISLFKGKAEILRNENLFEPYAKEYLF